MLFKKRPLLIALLLVIIIIFAFLASMRPMISLEGFDVTEDVPSCGDMSVPGCYQTVLDRNYFTDHDYNYNEDYILKTEIVPPVCPACPTMIKDHLHGKDKDKGTGKGKGKGDGSFNINTDNKKTDFNQTNITNINTEENIVNNNEETVDIQVENREIQKNDDEENDSNRNSNRNDDNNNQVRDNLLSQYEKTISDLRGQISNFQQSSSSSNTNKTNGNECSPCPAPMRCPEPAFSCQKVINYRSPSAGQYLPMPVLNDFSTFETK